VVAVTEGMGLSMVTYVAVTAIILVLNGMRVTGFAVLVCGTLIDHFLVE
jgi:hypothetical protein